MCRKESNILGRGRREKIESLVGSGSRGRIRGGQKIRKEAEDVG